MTISYNWLNEYLPETIVPEQLSTILTSIGLEVESMEKYESIKGGLQGLVTGKVLTCKQHPNADKLKITTVDIGSDKPVQIVCGAPNVIAGQKVIVATTGTTIYPLHAEPVTMKVANIRGTESFGMICAEDEIGIGNSHAGIIVLPDDVPVGTPAADYFKPYNDIIFEIGLTPNRMDAMSHLGVAKDVCAYLSYHTGKAVQAKMPYPPVFEKDDNNLPVKVTVENIEDCHRYSGVSITGIAIKESPRWLQNKLKAIGVRPINNIVDITNYVLHETGQPLHAFDADAITGKHVIIRNLPEGTPFVTLDNKERTLHATDLMICDEQEGMCIAGVFGGAKSGVTNNTKNIFLESAWFNPSAIRRTSVVHNLRTDAAAHFEKGVDISAAVHVLQRAALLIKNMAGGSISSDIVDVYANKQAKARITLSYNYLKKLSGKVYKAAAIKTILTALRFEIINEEAASITVDVPYSKPDIGLPADIVEEIVRIDGLDNIVIPSSITLSPAIETTALRESLKDTIAQQLVGLHFYEIMTNSITNSNYYSDEVLQHTVKMMNNLRADLDVMRPSMLQTGLEAIVYNTNRKATNLRFFEFGKTYHTAGVGSYTEEEHCCLYITGNNHEDEWNNKAQPASFYTIKGFASAVFSIAGINNIRYEQVSDETVSTVTIFLETECLGSISQVSQEMLLRFDIKQPVFFADIFFDKLIALVSKQVIVYKEVPRFPAVQRDIAMILNKDVLYKKVEEIAVKQQLTRLINMRLFDVFQSDKIGMDKKSFAISFTFSDEEKTLTDNEIDGMMNKLTQAFEKDLSAEIRKH